MKKLLFASVLLFLAGLCFAKTNVIEDEDENLGSFEINIGGTYYGTNRLSDFATLKPRTFNSSSFTMEFGIFKSDEDGLFDLVSANFFGFGVGKVYSDGFNFYKDSTNFVSYENAKHWNIYGKDLFGLQVNLFAFSVGTMIGPKYGFDRMKQTAYSEFNNQYKFAENRIFLDFVLDPYVSVNLFHTVKIFLKSDIDLPVFRIRFMDYSSNGYKSDTIFKWDWFKNDIPVSYMAGVAVFF